jgi:tRNA threonylcarbamoyladenosine biosynthesis protein TsaE
MPLQEYILKSEEETSELAKNISSKIKKGDIITFTGDLGSGKSFLCRHIIKSLCGRDTKVISPTFNLLQIYQAKEFEIYHFDLYRLNQLDEIYELGIEEAFSGHVCLIEWPAIISSILPKEAISIEVEIIDETMRRVRIGNSPREWYSKIQ